MPATQADVVLSNGASDDLILRLIDARRRTDQLFALIKPDSLYERPIAERHRIVFYIGHLEAFDWNVFRERVFGRSSFHPEFDRLFAFGIDPVDGGLPSDRPSEWPAMPAVREYVGQIRNTLDDELADALAHPSQRIFDGFPLTTLLNVAIEHRLMHAETLAYMLHQLPLDRKWPHREPLQLTSSSPLDRNIEIPAGEVMLGMPRSARLFGWDNEFESQMVNLPGFSIDRYKVTNRQYMDFISAGGYANREFWMHGIDDEDWKWISQKGISHPAFWKRVGNDWFYRTMFAEIPLPLDWPVYVSHAEAQAYANWAGKSLPIEAEWQRAAYGSAQGKKQKEALGGKPASPNLGNFDFAGWSPIPVNAPQERSAFGVDGMIGNGWEWTATRFAPFPGFEPFPFYRGYSAPFFDGKHFVMKGGSARTAACMLRPTFRNWFQPHYQYMYAGFRCISRHLSEDAPAS